MSPAGLPVIAVSRRMPTAVGEGVTWLQHDLERGPAAATTRLLASAGPLRLARKQAEALPGLERMVALSSASLRFKTHSPDAAERALIQSLAEEEQALGQLAVERGFQLSLLRPTLIYGGPGPDALDAIRNWLHTRNWLPVAGNGLRQPVHADDLAEFMLHCLAHPPGPATTLELGGGETLGYRDFLRRIAASEGRDPRLIHIPAGLIGIGLRAAHALGRLKALQPAMVARQRMDLVVDDRAARALGWNPGAFRP
ncbi:MAG: NAD-dependent dehydratase [Wenzhouxiangellaceae bacterium]|nr:NAD-dependent dehydratase [Wenzhouxiangellaceae bacterium]